MIPETVKTAEKCIVENQISLKSVGRYKWIHEICTDCLKT